MNNFDYTRIGSVSCKYGAPMGRPNRYAPYAPKPVVMLSRLKFVDGDYDEGGAYWGLPANVYWCRNITGTVEMFVRADSLSEARTLLLEEYPDLIFVE